MRLPSLPRDGMSVAKICTDLINYLKVSRLTSVKGGRLRQTPSGQVLEIEPPPTPDPGIAPPLWVTPFYDADDTEWKYNVNVGHVTEQNVGLSGGLAYYTPTLDGTPLDADPAPIGVLPDTACKIYLQVSTDAKGKITSTPTIVSSTSDISTTHHVPPSPSSSGVNGDYNFLIAEFETNNESTIGSPLEVKRIPGNRSVPNQLIEAENAVVSPSTGETVGAVYQGYSSANDKHTFRQIVGKPGTTVTQTATSVEIDGGGGHPWKVTASTGGTVDIAAGKLLSYDHEIVTIPAAGNTNLSSYFNLQDFASYAGGNVQVLGAGVIYAKTDRITGSQFVADTFSDSLGGDFQHWLNSIQPDSVVTVEWAASMPSSGDIYAVKLAEVSLNAGDAQVDEQIVTHNPTLFVPEIQGFYLDIP